MRVGFAVVSMPPRRSQQPCCAKTSSAQMSATLSSACQYSPTREHGKTIDSMYSTAARAMSCNSQTAVLIACTAKAVLTNVENDPAVVFHAGISVLVCAGERNDERVCLFVYFDFRLDEFAERVHQRDEHAHLDVEYDRTVVVDDLDGGVDMSVAENERVRFCV